MVKKLKKNLVLTGMMGVGKSTIGEKLSKKLGLEFIDIDRVIEKVEKNTNNIQIDDLIFFFIYMSLLNIESLSYTLNYSISIQTRP